jgi:hypothetical protein
MDTRKGMAAACLTTGFVAATIFSGGAAVAGVSGPAFYVDHQLYRTVGTPTDLSRTGAPAQAWDLIYDFGGAQMNVATAAPGDAGYNGGRWQVHALSFPSGYSAALAAGDLDHDGVLDSTAEVLEAITSGAAVDTGVVKQFECPVIPLSHGKG